MTTDCKNIPWSLRVAATLLVTLTACTSDPSPTDSVTAVTAAVNAPGSPDTYAVIDCLLPGQIHQLGKHTTFVTARRPVRTTGENCAIRAGEYVTRDRADYGTSLKTWLADAQTGSAEGQYYVATLYENGDGKVVPPDYRQAAEWYRKAAEQGDKRAMIGLGRLYEQGLGLSKDPEQAFTWFRKASGLSEGAFSSLANTQVPQAKDLGFDGPSLEVIDPPLVRTRGIQPRPDDLAIPVDTGVQRSVTGRVLAPAGLQTLLVNGEKITPSDNGVFTATLRALRSASDELLIQILAKDTQDKQTTMKFTLKAKGALQPTTPIPKQDIDGFGRYHALVIGNDQYTHWPKLKNAISDATAIAKVLEERYGFQVRLLKDAGRTQIMKALNQYTKELTEKDNLIIYYAGHGHLEQGIERGYWISVDAETDDNSEWVRLSDVTDQLQLISAKHVMVVADSCFSGKLTRSLSLAQMKPGLTDEERFEVLKQLAQERVRTAMSSGGVKPVLDAGGSGHSVFAEAFLGVLEDNVMILEARRLFDAIHARVISNSQKMGATQIPTYDPINMAGHESIGDFIFVPQTPKNRRG
ncbi:MAG: hypothetical protein HOO98_06830 [Nitrospira sp.]|nr:hypothetical protein [Nitrospira sp.]